MRDPLSLKGIYFTSLIVVGVGVVLLLLLLLLLLGTSEKGHSLTEGKFIPKTETDTKTKSQPKKN